jgi:hypothetical protein
VQSAEFCWRANPFKFRMFLPIQNTSFVKSQGLATFVPSSVSRFYARGNLLAFFSCTGLP